ncbi:phage protein [Photobacterium aphoticum]|uniref:Phage protein n=1 Tax=Photobacterium aphoticum TaxID=754436 RepID=A0A090R1G1_9GAMM|nr:phage protein [Photobacterium aphoticum]
MEKAKSYASKIMATPFQQGWQWIIEVTGDNVPMDFEIYVKDLDFGLGSIDADVTNIGSGSIGKPTSSNAGEVTMTVRDHIDGRVLKWFQTQLAKVKHPNGTVGLPKDYVFTMTVWLVSDAAIKTPLTSMQVFAVKCDTTLSYESEGQFIAYPMTFQKFSTLGAKPL